MFSFESAFVVFSIFSVVPYEIDPSTGPGVVYEIVNDVAVILLILMFWGVSRVDARLINGSPVWVKNDVVTIPIRIINMPKNVGIRISNIVFFMVVCQ